MKKSLNPTESQIDWLKENFEKFKNSEIAKRFSIKEWRVSVWLKQLGLTKFKRVYGGKRKAKKRQKKFEQPKPVRVPAQYSNISREQHIERILNMNI